MFVVSDTSTILGGLFEMYGRAPICPPYCVRVTNGALMPCIVDAFKHVFDVCGLAYVSTINGTRGDPAIVVGTGNAAVVAPGAAVVVIGGKGGPVAPMHSVLFHGESAGKDNDIGANAVPTVTYTGTEGVVCICCIIDAKLLVVPGAKRALALSRADSVALQTEAHCATVMGDDAAYAAAARPCFCVLLRRVSVFGNGTVFK